MGSDPGLSHTEAIELPVMIKTLVIDGKRMTTSFFKQIALEGIIDEATGDVRGTPLGWLNIHQKDCPDEAHLHVLWTRGSALRLATVLTQVAAVPMYHQRQGENLERRQGLLDLLAYCLAPHYRSAEAGYEQGFYYISLGGYRLPFSKEVRSRLASLEEARKQYEVDLSAWQQGAELPLSPNIELFLQQARELRIRLGEQGISLAHPRLYDHVLSGELRVFGVYDSRERLARVASASPSAPRNTRAKHKEWFIYSGADGQAGADTRSLYWRVQRNCTNEQAAEIEAQFATQVALLRVLLAQQAVQIDLQNIQTEAVELALGLHLISEKPEESRQGEVIAALKPAALYELYQREGEHFAAYTERWQRHVDSFQELDQLFLVS
jgi:hypothetical protein